MRNRPGVSWAVLVILVLGILWVLMTPSRPAGVYQDGLREWIDRAHEVWLSDSITFDRIEWLANVSMFVPLGYLGYWLFKYWWFVLSGAAAVTVSAEIIQHNFLDGRVGSVADVVANLMGACLGLLIAARQMSRKKPATAGKVEEPVGGTGAAGAYDIDSDTDRPGEIPSR